MRLILKNFATRSSSTTIAVTSPASWMRVGSSTPTKRMIAMPMRSPGSVRHQSRTVISGSGSPAIGHDAAALDHEHDPRRVAPEVGFRERVAGNRDEVGNLAGLE